MTILLMTILLTCSANTVFQISFLQGNYNRIGGENRNEQRKVRKDLIEELPPAETCYLVVYDFKGSQIRDKKTSRLINPFKNNLRNQFYEWLKKHYPDLMPRNAINSAIEVGNREDAEIIYNKVS